MSCTTRALLPALLIAALALPDSATAQRVYKCIDENGSVSFQNTQCPDEVRQERPAMDKPPTLTPEQEFRAEAARLGMSPEQLAIEMARDDSQSQRSNTSLDDGRNKGATEPVGRQGGFGRAAQASRTVTVCTAPDGSLYVQKASLCELRKVRGPGQVNQREWTADTVEGMPHAHMTGPDTAVDAMTGRVIQLRSEPTTVFQPGELRRIRDEERTLVREAACTEAKQRRDLLDAHKDRSTFDQRRQAGDHVRAVCRDLS